ncbi:MAG: ABC-three component system protein [Chthoniobacteraceae bacterium]
MSAISDQHSAEGPFAGYLFQLDWALIWLGQSPIGASVGIETLDDIAMAREDGGLDLGQSKLSYCQNLLADRNPNLWKTLSIWLKQVAGDEIDLSDTEFYLLSNFQVRTGVIAALKGANGEKGAIKKVAKQLKLLASAPSQSFEEYGTDIATIDNSVLCEVLKKIRVLDGFPSNPEAQIPILAKNLRLQKDIARKVIRGIRGWLLEQVQSAFSERRPAWIERESFLAELHSLESTYADNRLVLRSSNEIEVSPEARSAEEGAIFVEQLRWVEVENDEILDAISDYLQSIEERTRLAAENNVSKREYQSFESRLVERWTGLHRQAKDQYREDPELAGRAALRNTLNHREPLAGQPTSEFYLTRGTYHKLANLTTASIGWHPQFKGKLMEISNHSDESSNGI